jgi:hypothetical protein
MDAADGAPSPARICLLTAGATVTLDLGPRAAPFLAPHVAAERALVFLVCPRFDLGDSFRFLPEIEDPRLSILDLGRVQVVEGIEKTAKVVM